MKRGIPIWLKLAYAAFLAVWIPVYWAKHGPANFLWLCDLANFVVGVGLFVESSLVLSSQAVGVLFIQLLWLVDVTTRLTAGFHPIGGTEYMFDETQPLWLRLLSLFHVAVPAVLVWMLVRLGYDRRGWKLQTAITWALLPLTYLLTDPEKNVNWLARPFGVEQTLMPPPLFVPVAMLAMPLVLYLPTHALLAAWARRTGRLLPRCRRR